MHRVRTVWIVMALIPLLAALVVLGAWSLSTATSSAVNAQEGGNDDGFIITPFVNQAFGSINIDDECLVTNRRELEGPVEVGNSLTIQGIMVITSSCPEDSGSPELQTEVQVFSIICTKDKSLAIPAICDVNLVAQEQVGDSSGGGSGRGRG